MDNIFSLVEGKAHRQSHKSGGGRKMISLEEKNKLTKKSAADTNSKYENISAT